MLLLCLCLDTLFPFRPQLQSGRLLTDNDGKTLTAFLSPDEKWRFPIRRSEVSPLLIDALILKEDRRFFWHVGIDPLAVLRAAVANVAQGRRTSGASTITMQVARLLQPRPRTLWAKLLEAIHAVQLEWHYSKDEILEMYLWLLPYGSNVEGVRAASMMFLGTTPAKLSVAEAATLLVVPNRPSSLGLGAHPERLRNARNAWITRLQAEGLLSSDEARAALSEPLNLRRMPAPRQAWHLAVRLSRTMAGVDIIRSSIHGPTQQLVEALTRQHVQRLRALGITNASAIVVDNATRRVLAYVGSADVYDVAARGQVDGVKAVRSPGSTLKPLIYALAIDQGLMTPKTMVVDVPMHFDGYAPENFDRRYAGALSMEEALATSRNVPAVATLDRLGMPTFLAALDRARMSTVRNRRLGLSAALGGCGMRLDELVGIYAAFANSGVWSPLRWTANQPHHADTTQLVSPGAAYAISEILTTLSRPDIPSGFESSARLPRIAWKTGTSYGRRDAWAIGYNRRFTVGVWVGNFDGSGNEHLTGSECATPLLFDIVNAIDRSQDARWLVQPPQLDVRLVCTMSGHPPADSCTNQVVDVFIPGVSSPERCSHQRETYVQHDGRMAFCTSCLPPSGWVRRMELDMPAPVLMYMRDNGVSVRLPPPHNPACTRVFDGTIRLTAPANDKTYILENGTDTQLRCSAQAPSDATTLYWFINDAFITSSPAGSVVFIAPQPGRQTLTCVDDRGRRAASTFTVRRW